MTDYNKIHVRSILQSVKQKPPSEAISIGACLSDPLFSLRRHLDEAERLIQIQTTVRRWLPSSLGDSIRVAAEHDGELVLHADSAAALVEIRYRQDDLLAHLRTFFDLSATKIVTKIVPST